MRLSLGNEDCLDKHGGGGGAGGEKEGGWGGEFDYECVFVSVGGGGGGGVCVRVVVGVLGGRVPINGQYMVRPAFVYLIQYQTQTHKRFKRKLIY